MSTKIKIGHASGSENSENRKDGEKGDQTGNEVLIKKDYDISTRSSPFTVLLRPKRRVLAVRSANACEAACKNSKVGYGQSDRNTLYTEGKKVNLAFNNITTPCNTDCSAFMTACAVAGGAKFAYAIDNNDIGNAPTCSNMERWFTSCQDYIALKSDQYLSKTDYMKRGDILVDPSAHTVMVLENGCAVPPSIDLKFDIYVQETGTKTADFKIKISQIDLESGAEDEEDDESSDGSNESDTDDEKAFEELLAFYEYKYEITKLSTGNVISTKKITLTESEKDLSLSGLSPDTSYCIRLIATEKESEETEEETLCELSSPSIIFKTQPPEPSKLRALHIGYSFENLPTDLMLCTVLATPPSDWGDLADKTTGYRVSLLVNGQVIAYNDELITSSSPLLVDGFALSSILDGEVNTDLFEAQNPFDYENTIQICIQPFVKSTSNKYYFNSDFIASSRPFKLRHFLTKVDKMFIKVDGQHKRTLLIDNLKD